MREKLIEGLRDQHQRDSAELRRLCAERDHLRAERDSFQRVGIAAQARAERMAEALQWYVDNDDTNDGQEGNEFWLAGRDRARALLRDHDKEVGNG